MFNLEAVWPKAEGLVRAACAPNSFQPWYAPYRPQNAASPAGFCWWAWRGFAGAGGGGVYRCLSGSKHGSCGCGTIYDANKANQAAHREECSLTGSCALSEVQWADSFGRNARPLVPCCRARRTISHWSNCWGSLLRWQYTWTLGACRKPERPLTPWGA